VNGSIQIGSILGIKIRVHVLLLVLLGFIVLGSRDAGMAALLTATTFGIVLLHELAHSVVRCALDSASWTSPSGRSVGWRG
jgi:hypothetical protein